MGKTGGDVLYTVVLSAYQMWCFGTVAEGKQKNMTCNDNWFGRHSGLGRRDLSVIIIHCLDTRYTKRSVQGKRYIKSLNREV